MLSVLAPYPDFLDDSYIPWGFMATKNYDKIYINLYLLYFIMCINPQYSS